MTLKIKILTTLLLFLIVNHINAQGCSDAGVCTINSFKPQEIIDSSQIISQIKIGASYGQADHDISVLGNYLEL